MKKDYRKACKRYQSSLKRKKKQNIVVNDTKINQKKRNKSLLSIEKKILSNVKKILIMIIKKMFSFRKCTSILKSNDLELCFSRID